MTGGLFLLPAAFVLTVWIIYPAVYTIVRSFFGQQGYLGTWVGLRELQAHLHDARAADRDP